MKKNLLIVAALLTLFSSKAQILTKEDSLAAGLLANASATAISGYGSVKYKYEVNTKQAEANLDRAILFVGHKFSKKISFFSELEVEDAKVAGGEAGGEVSLEQAFLKFAINNNNYITAGLFIPRIGIINENHLPTTFNGNERPFVEQLILPATWREIGIGLYGNITQIPGLNYSMALVNGLNSGAFTSGDGIRGGRYEGRNANASAMAVTGALLYYVKNFRFQISGYYGGSAGLTQIQADTLHLSNGAFGTPVALAEANMQYHNKGWSVKGLFSTIRIKDAMAINNAYGNNTAEALVAYYGEVGYNILKLFKKSEKNLTIFARYENLDMNNKLAPNTIFDGTLNQQYLIGGVTFQPVRGVTIKADYVFKQTGDQNPMLASAGQTYNRKQGFFSLGVGYSF
jgi:opacity protein-like surface antigen